MNKLIEKEEEYVQKRLFAQPLRHLIGATFKHYKKESELNYYNITGFTEDKETSRLVVAYRRTLTPFTFIPYSQPAARFFGTVITKEGVTTERFQFVGGGDLIRPLVES